jgi:hypothetical protein
VIWRSRSARLTARLEAECGEAGRELARARGEATPVDQFEVARIRRQIEADRAMNRAITQVTLAGNILIASGVAVLVALLILGVVLAL